MCFIRFFFFLGKSKKKSRGFDGVRFFFLGHGKNMDMYFFFDD